MLNLLCLCSGLIFIHCQSEDPEPIQQQKPVVVTDKPPVDASVTSSGDTTSSVTTSFPDSAFFRPSSFNNMPYQIMFPRKYDSTKTYPVVIFLHGIDERGTDNQKQLLWGASLFRSDSVSREFPSFIVFPQCPATNYWSDTSVLENLKELIERLATNYSIDRNRIYIEGLSMGAYGVYAAVAKYPDLFAAAVAISGDGDESKAQRMAQPGWKIYGGKRDTIVPAATSEKMAAALSRSGATVSVKIYPDANHVGSWVKAFAEPDFCSWVFARRKD